MRSAAPAPEAAPPAAAAAPAPPPARRADHLERRVEETLSSLEERLEDVAARAGLAGATGDLRVVLARLLPRIGERLSAAVELVRLLDPPERLDRYGMDPRFSERAQPLLELLYATWWRVEVRAIDRVPAVGPALVVANHGGGVPWDALVLRHALRRDHPAHRDLRPLLDDRECALPLFGGAAVRLGAVRASPESAEALLAAGSLVGVFPEGSSAARRAWRDRYRIQRFGRGGFAKIALRTGAPVVPCAIVGSEEAAPAISRSGWLADLLNLPGLAASPLLRLAPAAAAPLPSKWTLRFGEPIAPGAGAAADDPAAVNALTERARATIQEMLDEDVAARASVFL
jgi:1-acyl-sn-glycerol-3-phosphate acyltransferase